jgi:hypothetical protein
MQSYSISGTVTVTNGSLRNIVSLADVNQTTGTNALTNNQSIPTGSWVALDTGSNATMRFAYIANTNETSSVKIASGNTASLASVLQPGDFCILTNTGSNALYAFASGSSSPVQLQYIYIGL